MRRARHATLFAVSVMARAAGADSVRGNVALVQVTDLGVHAKIGLHDGIVWVTGISDGLPRANAYVVVHDAKGRAIGSARTDAQGIARFASLADKPAPAGRATTRGELRHLSRRLRERHARRRSRHHRDQRRGTPTSRRTTSTCRAPGATIDSPRRRGVHRAGHLPARASGSTPRRSSATASLGALARARRRRLDQAGASTTGTTRLAPRDDGRALRLRHRGPVVRHARPTRRVGSYRVDHRGQARRQLAIEPASTSYRVAEYRPPEFLVDVTAPSGPRIPGDTLTASVAGALPVRRADGTRRRSPGGASVAALALGARRSRTSTAVPSARRRTGGRSRPTSGTARRGERDRHARRARPRGAPSAARPSERAAPPRVTVEATVTDINRQAVGVDASRRSCIRPSSTSPPRPTGTD